MKKRIQIQGFLIFLAIIAVIFFRGHLLAQARPLEWLWNALGIIMICLGYALRISARGHKAELSSDGRSLVTAGPYALLRNPMYFGTLCIGLGVIITLFQWWVVLAFMAIYLSIYIPQINREEAKLLSFFGDKFRDYCRQTPKFFPRPAFLFSAKDYLRFKLSWVKKELFSFLATLIFVVGVKIWLLIKWQ